MTYGRLKNLTTVILSGDSIVPDSDAETSALLQYALEEIGTRGYSEKLTVPLQDGLPEGREAMSLSIENKIVLRPLLPTSDDDIIDIDEGLCYPLARFMASVISIEKMEYHRNIAFKEIEAYNTRYIALSEREALNGIR